VVLAYLAYTIVDAYQQLPTNYYAELNLTPFGFNTKDLKTNFKRLSLQAHPDKNDGSDTRFLKLRDAYETLSDPVRRFAYDRFGLDQHQCQSCHTRQDYQTSGLSGMLGYYIATTIVLGMFSIFGKIKFGSYWRWLFLCTMLITEMSLSFWSESWPGWFLGCFMPNITIKEQIGILHQIYMSFFIAVSQIGPLWIKYGAEELSLEEQLLRANAFIALISQQSTDALRESFAPIKDAEDTDHSSSNLLNTLQQRVNRTVVNLRLMEDPEHAQIYSETMKRVVTRRRRV
jgi:curved DNA-binding protein CbpA